MPADDRTMLLEELPAAATQQLLVRIEDHGSQQCDEGQSQ
jgi:hypothetical protein